MKHPILYTFRRCPYAIRARMALSYCRIKIELREILLKDRPKQLYDASNKGTVPVLITKDNKVTDESLDIMLWALQNNNKQTWFNFKNANEDLEMIKVNDTIFKKSLDKYKYNNRYSEKNKELYRSECCKILNVYEKKLAKYKYLNDDKIKIVDIAIFPFVRQFANVDYIWFSGEFNNLRLWLEKISNSKLFNSVMRKYDIWNPSIYLYVDLSTEI